MKKLTNPLNIELERRLHNHYVQASQQQVQTRPAYDEQLVDDFVFQVNNTREWLETLQEKYYAHLMKFIQKGTYDSEKALKLFHHFLKEVGPLYAEEYAPGAMWYDVVAMPERREIAQRLLEWFEAKQSTGELDYLLQ